MEGSPIKLLPTFGAETLQNLDASPLASGGRVRASNRQFVHFYNKKFLEVYTVEAKIDPKSGSSKPLKVATREVEREMVHIITPGDKNEYDGESCDFHKREHWHHYKAFRDGTGVPLGTPIDECDFVAPQIGTELKYRGCHTLEQLADSSDLLCGQIANGWELREYARAVCKTNLDNKSLNQVNVLKAELEKSQAMIAELQAQMKTVQKRKGDA